MRRVEAENSQVISCLHSWKINGPAGERETSFGKIKIEREMRIKWPAGCCGVDFLQSSVNTLQARLEIASLRQVQSSHC